jgi:hypothetical protein
VVDNIWNIVYAEIGSATYTHDLNVVSNDTRSTIERKNGGLGFVPWDNYWFVKPKNSC